MRIRQRLFRFVTVVTVGAMVASGVAVTPARAATSDFSLSVTAAALGVDTVTLISVVSSVNAADVRDGLSLDQAAKRQVAEMGGDTSRWVDVDLTATVSTDGTLTITVPGAEVQTTTSWYAQVISTMVGLIVGYGLRAGCIASLTATGVGSALVPLICTPVGAATGTFTQALVQGAFDGKTNTPEFWTNTLIKVVFAAVGAYTWEKWVSPWSKNVAPDQLKKIATAVKGFSTKVAAFFGALAGNTIAAIGDLMNGIATRLPAQVGLFDADPPATGPLPCDS